MLTFEKAKEIFDYCPETGVLTWSSRVKNTGQAKPGKVVGHKHRSGYITVFTGGKHYPVHRIVWLIATGNWPVNQIDHIDGNRMNNRLSNLRDVTTTQNMQNKSRYANSSSGVVGVSWQKRDNVWQARITVEGRYVHLGYFQKFEDAVRARKEAEQRFGFHKNHGRTTP